MVEAPGDPYSGFTPPDEPEEATVSVAGTPSLLDRDPRNDTAVIQMYERGVHLLGIANEQEVTTEDNAKDATDLLGMVKGLAKDMEEARKGYSVSLDTKTKAVNAAFAEYKGPVKEADTLLQGLILGYNQRIRDEQAKQEEINRLRELAAQKDAELHEGVISEPVNLVEVTPDAPAVHRGVLAKSGIKQTWAWELEDRSKVPAEYMMLNEVKIGQRVRAGEREIPGIRIFPKEGLSVTAG